MPWGIDFNEQTGTFKGIPDEVGEYIVPVKVETNYGSDQKDVKIVIEPPYCKVKAIGTKAKAWSGGATPDEYGFYDLPMPPSNQLVSLRFGFGAKTGNGWYICSGSPLHVGYKENELDTSLPVKYPVDNILEISSGSKTDGTGAYTTFFLYRTSDDVVHVITCAVSNGVPLQGNIGNFTLSEKGLKLGKTIGYFAQGIAAVKTDGTITSILRGGGLGFFTPKIDGITIDCTKTKTIFADGPHRGVFLTIDGGIYTFNPATSGHTYRRIATPVDETNIKDIFSINIIDDNNPLNLFMSTWDEELYAMTNSYNYANYGLTEATGSYEFKKVGAYDVKKIVPGTFMLTTDGRLYHTGAAVSGITSKHTLFTQIFPEYNFQDIAYSIDKTLIVTVKE